MKPINLTLLLVLAVGRWAAAGETSYINNVMLTTRTNIDANVVINNGVVYFDLLSTPIADGEFFQTRDTYFFTNNGTMLAQPGFYFNTVTATGISPASTFDNARSITAVDAQTVAFYASGVTNSFPIKSQPPGTEGALLIIGGTTPILAPVGPGTNTPIPSAIVVSATNIVNTGQMSVGDLGVLTLNGANVNLNNGSLVAGSISELDTNANTGRGVSIGYAVAANSIDSFFTPPADVYDIYWSVANNSSELGDIEEVQEGLEYPSEGLPLEVLTTFPWVGYNPASGSTGGSRNGTVEGESLINYWFPPEDIFPMNSPYTLLVTPPTVTTPPVVPDFQSFVYTFSLAGTTITTNYYSIVFVNTAFADTNISAQVSFDSFAENTLLDPPTEYPGDEEAVEPMIKFSVPVVDVITGQTVTNSIYFLDTSAAQIPAFYSTNSIYAPLGGGKPLGFEISRVQPVEWLLGLPANDVFDPTVLYTAGEFQNVTATMTNSFYCAQVGRNPEQPNGLFDYTASILGATQSGMPDIASEPARIEINASKTNQVSNLRLRANGFVNINSTNFLGNPAAVDFGNFNVNLSNPKNPLVISNLFPATFHRLRGDIAAYTADWSNIQTNSGTGTTNRITNYFVYHVLIVDQDLRSSFQTTAQNVSLRGSNVVLDDTFRVMGSAVIQATNLTLNTNFHLTSAAGALVTTNLSGVKNLLIGSGGSVTADNYIDVGYVASAATVNPTKQNTPIVSITNLGNISSGTIELQSQIFANGGSMMATNNGAITLNAITNYLGAGALGLANVLQADGNVALTSTSIQVTNSTILAGQSGYGRLILYASSQLTDHYPNTASTKRYHTNLWQVTGGFSMPVKPASGDLYATQIKTIAGQLGETVTHVWAGQDLGPNIAGFFNNEVIGHLILDRTTNAFLQFSAAGKKNALYVDYLELQDLAFSDYHEGLIIDPNLTIYFANANVEPGKLHQVYSNLVWVPQFAGPNSTTNVQYLGGSNCLMNAALRSSTDISTADDGVANGNSLYPLNNPTVGPVPCPSLVNSTETLSVANGLSGQSLVIWTTGQGTVTPSLAQKGVTAGQTNTLTATPASGWLFLGWSGAVTSSKPTISFVTPTNVFSFLTANFITNPFIGLAGNYYGLFIPSNAPVAANNSGSVTFTLNSQGVFSGKLSFGPTNYPFTSQFNITDTAAFLVTNGVNVLRMSLKIGDTLPGLATGVVSNANFDAPLTANRVPGWSASVPSPEAGSYTLVLPGNGNAAASPGGDSYGTVTVDVSGNLKAVGTLADNVSFSQAVPISKAGQWPFYLAPSGVPQTLIGWVTFDTTNSTFGGTVTWIKETGKGTYYTNGFTNSSVLLGSIYSAAYQKTNGLALTGPTITLSGGNLASQVIEPVNLSGLETYTSSDKTLTLTISASNGSFSGQYVVPGTGKKLTLGGAVLQEQGVARGFFLGTNQSGGILLQGN
jgi:hypothetical protein